MTLTTHLQIQQLFDRAQAVLAGSELPELMRSSIEELKQIINFRESDLGQRILAQVEDMHTDESYDVKIDSETVVHHNGDSGYWVMALCYVPATAVEDKDQDQDDSDRISELG